MRCAVAAGFSRMNQQVGAGLAARACLRPPGQGCTAETRSFAVGPRAALRLALGAAVVSTALLVAGCGDSKSAFEDYSFPRTSSESGRYLSDEEHARLREQWQAKQDAKGAQTTPQSSGGS